MEGSLVSFASEDRRQSRGYVTYFNDYDMIKCYSAQSYSIKSGGPCITESKMVK